MKIITISREFGSGGRELGKRLGDTLGMAYYDREILTALMEKTALDEEYLNRKIEEGNLYGFPVTFGHTFSYLGRGTDTAKLLAEQQMLIREIAKKGEDFIIIGRNADVALQEFHPLNLFVYADMESKVKRCRAREENGLTDGELVKRIRQVDKGRKKSRELLSDRPWGEKESYHLCINTSEVSIKEIVPVIASYANMMLGGRKE